MDLTAVRDDVLSHCDVLQDRQGPYGAYRVAPRKRTDLYSSLDMALARVIMGEDFRQSLSGMQRREWVEHINSFAQADGTYTDTFGHSALHANGMVIGALGPLDGRQLHPVRLYDAFSDPGDVRPWLEALDWRRQWSQSHKFWGGLLCYSMSSRCRPEWLETVFDWLDENLDPQTGWWRRGVKPVNRYEPLGGFVHIAPFYQHHRRTFPYPRRVIDSVLQLQLEEGVWLNNSHLFPMSYLELDALYALAFMTRLAPGYRTAAVLDAVSRYGRVAERFWRTRQRELLARHPHHILAAVGIFGLLQQILPDEFCDTAAWSDIFSDARLYQTSRVEAGG